MRSALLAVAVAGIVLATPGAAGAHVTVSAAGAVQGNYATVTVRVPNEKATAATVKVELLLPADTPVGSASVKPTTGWNVAVEKVPVTVPGVQITEAVSKITWTAGSGAAVQPNQFQEFDVALGPLPVADELVFGALQTYTDGEVVRWVDPPTTGPEPDHPAPVLKLAKAGALNDGTRVPAGTPAAAPTTAPADRTLTLALAAGALVLAAGGVVLGLVGYRR